MLKQYCLVSIFWDVCHEMDKLGKKMSKGSDKSSPWTSPVVSNIHSLVGKVKIDHFDTLFCLDFPYNI